MCFSFGKFQLIPWENKGDTYYVLYFQTTLQYFAWNRSQITITTARLILYIIPARDINIPIPVPFQN